MKLHLDKIVSRIVALGIPGLVLLAAVASSGFAGGAAIVAALAFLGGPLGMMGGMLALGVLLLISHALAEYGFQTIFSRVLRGLQNQGQTKVQILNTVESYPISNDLKRKLRDYIEELWGDG